MATDLADIFVQHNGGGHTDIEAVGQAVLGNGQPPEPVEQVGLELQSPFFVAQDKRTFFRQLDIHDRHPLIGFQNKQGISPVDQMGVTGVEAAVKKGGHPFERPHGRGRVKEFDAHQVDFPASERFRAPEYFSDIEGGFEVIQNQDTGMTPGAGMNYFLEGSFLDPGVRNRYNSRLNEQGIK